MIAQTYYTLETNDRDFAKRIGEDLNMLRFVFTHHPELKPTARIVTDSGKRRKTKEHFNPHSKIFNGPFTAIDLDEWRNWIDKVLEQGHEAIQLQHPAYRQSHRMALDRFRQDTDDFLRLFYECQSEAEQ